MIVHVKTLCLQQYLRSIETLNVHAEKAGVTIWLENLPDYTRYRPFHYIFTHAEEFKYILERVDNQMLYDVGHGHINARQSVQSVLLEHHARIATISLSNNNGTLDQHLALDQGTIDMASVLETLVRTRWRGLVAFETRAVKPSLSIASFLSLCERQSFETLGLGSDVTNPQPSAT
jgi:sugar phosphate isomerase/epimerase